MHPLGSSEMDRSQVQWAIQAVETYFVSLKLQFGATDENLGGVSYFHSFQLQVTWLWVLRVGKIFVSFFPFIQKCFLLASHLANADTRWVQTHNCQICPLFIYWTTRGALNWAWSVLTFAPTNHTNVPVGVNGQRSEVGTQTNFTSSSTSPSLTTKLRAFIAWDQLTICGDILCWVIRDIFIAPHQMFYGCGIATANLYFWKYAK